MSGKDLDAVDASLANLTPLDRIGQCMELDSRIAGKPGVISADSSMSDARWTGAGASSNGFAGSFTATSVGYSARVTLSGAGDKRPSAGSGARARHLSDLPDLAWIGDEALRLANARLGAKKGPTMTATLVVDRRAVGKLLGCVVGAPAGGPSVQQGRSFLGDKLGKKIFSPKLELIDDPLIPRANGSRPFDFEGIAAKPLPIIQGGALQNFFLDTYYAKKLSMAPTSGSNSNPRRHGGRSRSGEPHRRCKQGRVCYVLAGRQLRWHQRRVFVWPKWSVDRRRQTRRTGRRDERDRKTDRPLREPRSRRQRYVDAQPAARALARVRRTSRLAACSVPGPRPGP